MAMSDADLAAPSGVRVRLNFNEMYLGAMVGVRRRLSSVHAGYGERNGAQRVHEAEAWYFNLVGALGEIAASKAIGAYWPASVKAKKGEPDMPPDWQVRTLASHDYDLIVRDDDADDQRFILVTGNGPEFVVHGWIYGRDAKRPEWRRDRGGRGAPCFWVPQNSLRRIAESASERVVE